MADGYILTKQAADWVARNSQLQTGTEAPFSVPSFFEPTTEPQIFRNDTGETVPAYGVIRLTGLTTANERAYYTTAKPASTLGWIAINGPRDVAANEYGTIQSGPIYRILYDSADSPTNGKVYGVSGFKARSHPTGKPLTQILIHGIFDSTRYILRASIIPFTSILIKAPSGGIPGRVGALVGKATCEVLNLATSNDALSVSTVTTPVYNWSTAAVCANGDRYGMANWIDGRWQIAAEDCGDTGSTLQGASTSSTVTTPTDPLQLGSPPVLGVGGAFYPADWKTAGTGGGIE